MHVARPGPARLSKITAAHVGGSSAVNVLSQSFTRKTDVAGVIAQSREYALVTHEQTDGVVAPSRDPHTRTTNCQPRFSSSEYSDLVGYSAIRQGRDDSASGSAARMRSYEACMSASGNCDVGFRGSTVQAGIAKGARHRFYSEKRCEIGSGSQDSSTNWRVERARKGEIGG